MSDVETAEHNVTQHGEEETRREESQPDVDCQGSDDELLRRFLTDRNDLAFAQLVTRHGPMVMAVCRRVLWNQQDTEDAFQATILVLSRKARSVRQSVSLAGWLHKTAHRIALRARAGRSRRREQSLEAEPMIVDNSLEQIAAEYDRSVFEEELNRLPDKYRLPLFLCCVENKSREEAAEQLGCSAGALKGRLERGRRILRLRLIRRGVSLGVVLALVLQSPQAALAAQPIDPLLVESTVRASMQYSAGQSMVGYVSQSALSLANGSFEVMSYTTTKIVACCSLVIGALALSGHWLSASAVAENSGGEVQIDNLQTTAAQAARHDALVALAVDGKRQRGGKESAPGVDGKRRPAAGQGRKQASANHEPPGSIFNDKLRGFKFRLQWTDIVTVQEAVAFMERYARKGNPEIIGAYPDAEGRFLIVIGPPEAEQAIRKSLATSIIELLGIDLGNGSAGGLKIQKRTLQSAGRDIILEMAQIESVKVKVAAAKNANRDKNLKQLDAQLQAFEAELAVLKQQIQVADKYLKQLDQEPFGEAKETNAR